MKKARLAAMMLVIMFTLLFATTAGAVTGGVPDGEDHPYVVLLSMDVDGVPTWRCSATMLTPTVVLTAGHCTSNYPDSPFTGMRIYTESVVDGGNNTYPTPGGPNSVEAVSWAAHPLYETAPFFVHDVGIVILEEPGFDPGVFGTLPNADQFDAMARRRGHQDLTFTSVGYGLQQITSNPHHTVRETADRIRYVANPHLIQINSPGFTGDFSLLLSNNTSTGGTCFGDSGGPNFLGDSNVVAGVTSFGLNYNCAGTGGVFRMDRQDVLAFINTYLP